jgi:hypothetical protein
MLVVVDVCCWCVLFVADVLCRVYGLAFSVFRGAYPRLSYNQKKTDHRDQGKMK